MKLAGIYSRVSSSQQKESQTIESQVSELLEYAKQYNYHIPKEWIFRDEGYSGSNLIRPGLDRIRDLAAEQQLEAILIYAPDRLSRSYAYQVMLLEELNANVEVIFIKSPKSDSPESALLIQFQGMIAEYERALIMERSRRGKRHKAKRGVVNVLSGAPYGYLYIKKTETTCASYEILDVEAKVVRDIYRLFTENFWSIGKITKWLTTQKIPSKKGKSIWDRSTVWAILRNPAYMGKACFGKTTKVKRKKITRPLRLKGGYSARNSANEETPRSEWIEIDVPAIIVADTFELAQEQLKKNKQFATKRTIVPTLLQSIMYCKHCGYALYRTSTKTSKRKLYYYRCLGSDNWRYENGRKCDSRPIRQDFLDEVVWEHIIKLLEDPKIIAMEIKKRAEQYVGTSPLNSRKENLLKQKVKIQKSIDKLLDAYQEDLISLSELRERMPQLKKHQATLEAELKSLQAMVLFSQSQAQVMQNIDSFLGQLRLNAKKLNIEDKKKVLQLLVKEIVVDYESIEINHCIKLKGRLIGENDKSYLLRGRREWATLRSTFPPWT